MNTPVFPLTNWKPENEAAFDLEDSDDLIGIARELVDGNHPGVFTTVDKLGFPHSRWMATTSFDEFPLIYTLTAPHSRKLEHLLANPRAHWMFSNSDLSVVLNLTGKAEVIRETAVIKRAWRAIRDKSHAYFLHNFAERPGFAVIRTSIDHIECTVPKSCFRWTMATDTLVLRKAS